MFQLDDNFTESDLAVAKERAESNYVLRPNDILLLDVFTNKGERLIDPNFEMTQQTNAQVQQQRDAFQFTIQSDGTVVFPLIGQFELSGLTLLEAEQKVAKSFQDIYIDPFVKLRITNRRVIVLGAPGGKVIPLANENMEVTEVLALAEGIELGAKAQNIKVIRGDLIYRIDLSTISGLRSSNLVVEPGDVIYVEPWRRPWLETLRDVSPALSLVSSVLTLILVVQNLSQ
ncbi:MAG: polysaccharide biosynthesis/export family protein [Cyclobacteriaceae bacterium]